jgi:hypothetical protein
VTTVGLLHDLYQDKSMIEVVFSFLGLKTEYRAGRGEEAAMALFQTLAKAHGAGMNEPTQQLAIRVLGVNGDGRTKHSVV